jgi:hypothetical protein
VIRAWSRPGAPDEGIGLGMKRWSILAAFLTVATVAALPAVAGNGGKGAGCKPAKRCPTQDTTAPATAIVDPGDAATVAGVITVTGTATDDTTVASVEIAIDGGAFSPVSGTGAWSTSLDTATLADGGHTITARAKDAAGNVGTDAVAITVSNAPPPDTTAPTVTIGSPSEGATVSGAVTVSGTAADDTALASVSIRVDDGTWSRASGASTWSASIDTTAFADGAHTIAARAEDTSGNVTRTSIGVTVANTQTPPPSTSSPTRIVTPEGVTIVVDSAAGWTAQQIYDMLKPSARQLNLIGPTLTIKVQDTEASSTGTSTTQQDGRYTSFTAVIYLKGVNSNFVMQPDATIAHEYGHVWSLYHLYISRQGDWSSYLRARSLAGDDRLDSSYTWDRAEIIADDYRLLFGSATAIAQRSRHMNPYIADPRDVPGLRSFLEGTWTSPV